MKDRYIRSEEMHKRALKAIPLGTQTFSKSSTQYPFGVSPYFIKKGRGSHVWDVDGNEYVDFINSLAAITLGYNDPDVDAAVRAQLEEGVIFSLPHELEIKAAEKVIEMVPCAEMVRFGKNGSDATAGAIRVSRAFTKRDHVAVCGYHGWQDWYIGSTARNLGVPKATRELTHTFTYNNIDSLDKIFKDYPNDVAAVIMEPMNVFEPVDGFLEKAAELTRRNNAVFIFDETITGFRYANGGAGEYFNVKPDLATFGKGLANGYPVSAVAGRADIMRFMEDVFFSFTFGGETLSLAAALTTMEKLQREPVIKTIWSQGAKILDGLTPLIKKHGLEDILSTAGKPCWSFLVFKDAKDYTMWELKTLFLQEIFARGVLTLTTHNMSYAHTDEDIAKLLKAYDEVFGMMKEAVEEKSLLKLLRTEPLAALFKVR
ncbi:MAG: aminotransferase class III-fold pyridoxal phosphate-dependent enzyme [Deltaproteobacteria bacterium]|nr:aminotransferase class III-fold pyridoxal phosphate-dependent enzyme [Deltaproteobacteria bacterium]